MPHAFPMWLLLVPSIVGFQIGAFVLLSDWRSPLNRLVFATSVAVSLWNLENTWLAAGLPSAALAWIRLGAIFLPVLSLHVLAAWRGQIGRSLARFLALGYLWAAVLVVTGPRTMIVAPSQLHDHPALPGYVWTPGFLAYIVYFLATTTVSGYLLVGELKSVGRREKAKVTLVAVTTLAAIASAGLSLLFHAGHPLHVLNALTTLVYLAALTWVVVRYRFGNPSLFLRTSAVYSLVIATVTGFYVSAVVLLATWLQARAKINPLLVAFFCILVAGPLFHPFEDSLNRLLRRFFPLPRDLYYESLKNFLQELNVFAPVPELAGLIVARLASLFELTSLCLLVQPSEAPPFLQCITSERGWPESVFLPVPQAPPEEWTLSLLRRYSGLPLVAAFPLVGRSRQIGLLGISRHPGGSLPTSEEREVLHSLCHQAGIALENCELYEELVAVKNHYLTVLQSSASPLLVVDPQGLVEDANPAAEKVFGSLGGLLGRPVAEVTGQPLLASLVSDVLGRLVPLEGREITLPHPQGDPAPYAVNASPLVNRETRECFGAVLTFADLSPIRAMERQIERAERLAALGQLTAGLAHELRNGLNKIAGYATMLLDELDPDDPRRRFPAGILEDTNQLETMLRRFLSFAREEKLSRTTLFLPELVNRVLDALRPELKARRIDLVTDLPAQTPSVQGDPAQLSQALTNILLNAVEAMSGKGGKLTVGLRWTGRFVELRFSDTGPGIPPEQRELVFNPFFTTKPYGTGLGLSITHRIVTRHGGTVGLDSRPGQGTTVVVRLPRDSGRAETDQAERRAPIHG